jgi:hypothetical protein
VDGLELNVRQGCLEENRGWFWLVMEKQFELAHTFQDFAGWRWDKGRVARSSAADPVLGAAKLPWCLTTTAAFVQKDTVDLFEEPQ